MLEGFGERRPRAARYVTILLAAVLGVAALERLGAFASPPAPPPASTEGLARATFAGGCFWCMEPPFDKVPGVVSTTSGYMGGRVENPTYQQVSSGGTGHAEVVQVTYDPKKVSYEKLLEVFWHNVDPTVRDRQFCDVGEQYRTAIFVHDGEQRRLAEESKRRLEASGKLPGPVVTPVEDAGKFTAAEEYHQDFYKKNPLRYRTYRAGCGRDARLKQLWGDAASH
jgi:peptide-methionine (S)-S-oxide reductase